LLEALGSNSIQEGQPTRVIRSVDHQVNGERDENCSFLPLSRRFEKPKAIDSRVCPGCECFGERCHGKD